MAVDTVLPNEMKVGTCEGLGERCVVRKSTGVVGFPAGPVLMNRLPMQGDMDLKTPHAMEGLSP